MVNNSGTWRRGIVLKQGVRKTAQNPNLVRDPYVKTYEAISVMEEAPEEKMMEILAEMEMIGR